MTHDPYKRLAEKLDCLPNGFPATAGGIELRLLAYLFSPEEAELAGQLTAELQTPETLAASPGGEKDTRSVGQALKAMARKGLIEAGRTASGMGYKLMPFVVGIYEAQIGRINAELAGLFEEYYQQAFGEMMRIQPAFHRIIPVNESVKTGIEIQPYESAVEIVNRAHAWGVLDCICRTQKALIGQPCEHPIDVCMAFAPLPGVFDHHPVVHPMTKDQSLVTLRRAAQAGLVHSVSNSQDGLWYICNCCTCSCGILRGIAELGIANAVAYSPFVNTIDLSLCIICEACLAYCMFNALELDNGHTRVNTLRCVGCGACVPACPEGALGLVRRPEGEALPVPHDFAEWSALRLADRERLG